ncbi:MAG: heme-binding beta-barrel domain-containing protein [Nitrospirales bacterium]|nr:heme-binding beta-barrel domain-containing protein [Nitrospirales bacterium]
MLYGLRYSTVAWPLIQEQPFHEEVGYWLWDAATQQVMRCFMVPRGVLVNAGGDFGA